MSTATKNRSESTSGRPSPGRCIDRDQQSKASLTPLYITSALYELRSKRKHSRRSCISPTQYITSDQRTKSLSGAAVYQRQSAQKTPLRDRPADTCNVANTSVYQQWAAEPKARLNHTAASIRTVYNPPSAKRMPAAASEQMMQNIQNDIGKRHTV